MQVTHRQELETPISVAVTYRDPLLRAGLLATLEKTPGFDVAMVDGGGRGDETAPPWPAGAPVDVVVCDYDAGLRLVGIGAVAAPATGGRRMPRVLVVTARDRAAEIRVALDNGVQGYLLLGCQLDELTDGVRALHRGQRHLGHSAAQCLAESLLHQSLTNREADVLRLVVAGLSSKSVALELDIALGTVKAHVKAILAKLGARTRTEAAAVAQRRGLFSPAVERAMIVPTRTPARRGAGLRCPS